MFTHVRAAVRSRQRAALRHAPTSRESALLIVALGAIVVALVFAVGTFASNALV